MQQGPFGPGAFSGTVFGGLSLTPSSLLDLQVYINHSGSGLTTGDKDLTTPDSGSAVALLGIALAGIEVKNTILLVDFTNQLRQQGMPLIEAIERAGEVIRRTGFDRIPDVAGEAFEAGPPDNFTRPFDRSIAREQPKNPHSPFLIVRCAQVQTRCQSVWRADSSRRLTAPVSTAYLVNSSRYP